MQSKSQKAEISDASGSPVVSDASHTPGSWVVGGANSRMILRDISGICDGHDGYSVAVMTAHSLLSDAEARANAAFIVRAVNSHDALVEAVEELLATYPAAYRYAGKIDNRTDNAIKIARAALASSREVRS